MVRKAESHGKRWSEAVLNRVAAGSRLGSKAVEALRLVEAGRSQAHAAREVGVQAETVRKWVKLADQLQEVPETLRTTSVLTEDEIALARARIARDALAAGDFRSALEAMRDEARRQQLESDLVRQESVTILAHLHSLPASERRLEIQQRLLRLGLASGREPVPAQNLATVAAPAAPVLTEPAAPEPKETLPHHPPRLGSGNSTIAPLPTREPETATFRPAQKGAPR